jgi:hypothetical protein
MEISKTAPSRPFSRSKLCRKYKTVPLVPPLTKEGVSRVESVTQPGALWNTQLGGVSGAVVLVAQFVPSAQVPVGMQLAGPGVKVLTQPGGSAGAVTPSKFSLK